MSETYAQAIKAAKERYKEAMDDAAADALLIAEQHGKPLQTVCKAIAGDDWNALVQRSAKLKKAAGQTAEERLRASKKETARKARNHARAALSDPEERAALLKTLPEETKVEMRRTLLLEAAEPAPRVTLPEMEPWFEAEQSMALVRRNMRELAERLGRTRMTAHREEVVDEFAADVTHDAQQLRTDKGRAALSLVKEA